LVKASRVRGPDGRVRLAEDRAAQRPTAVSVRSRGARRRGNRSRVTAGCAVPQFIPQLAMPRASTQRYRAARLPLRPSSQRPCTASSDTSLPVLLTSDRDHRNSLRTTVSLTVGVPATRSNRGGNHGIRCAQDPYARRAVWLRKINRELRRLINGTAPAGGWLREPSRAAPTDVGGPIGRCGRWLRNDDPIDAMNGCSLSGKQPLRLHIEKQPLRLHIEKQPWELLISRAGGVRDGRLEWTPGTRAPPTPPSWRTQPRGPASVVMTTRCPLARL